MARGIAAAALPVLFLAACGGRGGSASEPTAPAAVPAPVAKTGPATAKLQEGTPRDSGLLATPPVPEGYEEMHALMVAPVGEGNAVLLGDEKRSIFIPIIIGGTEAVSITFRLNNQKFPRPVTHDLLDKMLERFGAELAKVHVDELKDGVFIGSVYLRHKGDLIEFDARPSDAIALAVGNDVPIYVARPVIEQAGIRRDELRGGGDMAPSEMPPAPELPDKLRPVQ